MKFIAIKTADGSIAGNISFYCKVLHVTRQGFYKYLVNRERPWKYQELANARCESMWDRMKSELFYGRYDSKKFTKAELKVKI